MPMRQGYFGPASRVNTSPPGGNMRGLSKGIAALAVGMLLGAPALRAQGAEFSLGGGIGMPLGDFDDVAKMGWHGLAAVSFVPNGWPVGIQIDGQYRQYNIKATGTDDLGGLIDTDNSITKFGINAGAGFDFKAGAIGLFVEGRFHNVFTEGSDATFIPITVG